VPGANSIASGNGHTAGRSDNPHNSYVRYSSEDRCNRDWRSRPVYRCNSHFRYSRHFRHKRYELPPYKQRSAGLQRGSRIWLCGRITVINGRVFQTCRQAGACGDNAPNALSCRRHHGLCHRKILPVLSLLRVGFDLPASRKPFAQTDLSLLPAKSAQADRCHGSVRTSTTRTDCVTRTLCHGGSCGTSG
jgi:hypothetical protein